MELQHLKPNNDSKQDEDVQFERDKESTIIPLTESQNVNPQDNVSENPLPAKEDTMGNSDFPPLTELEKQPKLEDEESAKK